MINSVKINRRELLKNTTLIMGGLFVGGRLWAQTTSTVPGTTSTVPGTTSQVPPMTSQIPGVTPGNPPEVLRDPSRRPDDPFRGPGNPGTFTSMYGTNGYGTVYSYGYYGTGYGYYGTGYGSSVR